MFLVMLKLKEERKIIYKEERFLRVMYYSNWILTKTLLNGTIF
jgi:hypothetical protein